MGRWYTDRSPNLGQKTRPYNHQQKKKRNCKFVDFAVPANDRIKLKECEKKDEYLHLARELKKLWNVLVTIIPIVIGAFGTVNKGLLKGLEDLEVGGREGTIQTTALLRTTRRLRRVLETWGDLLSLRLQWKNISVSWCEKNYNNNNNIKRTRKLLWIKLYKRNLIKGINTWSVPLVRYSGPFLK